MGNDPVRTRLFISTLKGWPSSGFASCRRALSPAGTIWKHYSLAASSRKRRTSTVISREKKWVIFFYLNGILVSLIHVRRNEFVNTPNDLCYENKFHCHTL